MLNKPLDYSEYIEKIFPELPKDKKIRNITFQITDNCNLCCSYCYQIHKHSHVMSFDIAKKFIDYVFDERFNPDSPFYIDETCGLIIEFIGGEPLLQIDLVEQITNYFEQRFAENPDSDWALFHVYNFSSNGTLYFTDKVQKYLKKYDGRVSIGISLDGCKELHDKCRCFPDGTGSYDLAVASALDQLKYYNNNSTKITISPDNVPYVFKGFKNMVELGFESVYMNCVFEDVWTTNVVIKYYKQLKMIADYIKENELQNKVFFVLFEPDNYNPLDEEHRTRGWCGTGNNMFSLDYKGDIFTCIRFMESSLDHPPIIIGNIKHGIGATSQEKEYLQMLKNYTANNISTQECLDCPIGMSCAYCAGCCYEQTGSLEKRTTTICENTKVEALATLYYYKITNDKQSYDLINKFNYDFVNNLISKKEFDYLMNWEEEKE